MLLGTSLASHMPAALADRGPDELAPTLPSSYPYDGSDDGMAAHGIVYSHLTIQQNVPNIGEVETAPKTQVNPTHEQGFGRAPGWQNGWMRKNIPADFHAASARHRVARLGAPKTNLGSSPVPEGLRDEMILNSGVHRPGRGKWQTGEIGGRHAARGNIASPQTVYLTAAAGDRAGSVAAGAWGEPL